MKVFILLMTLVSGSVFAQSQNLHMIEMSTNNTALGALLLRESGGAGKSDRTQTAIFIGGNYAYKISPRVQLGIMGDYYRSFNESLESFGVMVGGIYNFDDLLTNASYVSLYGGYSWFNYYEDGVVSGRHQQNAKGKLAFGKRFSLDRLNLPSVTYSPEISYTRTENSKNSGWTNEYAIRFLQFSVFF